jgi:DASS family divalent anion:Na+ symporter
VKLPAHEERRIPTAVRWALVFAAGIIIVALPRPPGIELQGWRLLAIFVATIVGLVVQPLPGGAMVLLGICSVAVLGILPAGQALAGYADPIVWLVLAAFMIARAMIKTGLGRRIALLFVRFLGGTSLGLAYSLALTDGVLASVIPSNGARCAGVIFPVTKSIAESYGSTPGPTANRLGSFLLPLVYQTDVIICAIFLTGQASNPLIVGFATEVTGITLTYGRWLVGALVPGVISLLLIPVLVYRLFPPDVRRTPEAASYASAELQRMGPLTRGEVLMLATFIPVLALWVTTKYHGIDYAVVALMGLAALLLTGVLSWQDVISERPAWDVFVWYGGLVQLARSLGDTGVTRWFADQAAGFTAGWQWGLAMAVLLIVYFYAHYGFASITAHATAMYIPFLVVAIAAGAPPLLAVLLLSYTSNLSACLTHYGTTPAPVYYGTGYVTQRRWWQIGFLVSVPHILVWSIIGLLWWKLLGWW